MILKNSQGFVIYKLPYEKEIYIRKGDWEKFDHKKEGFIVQDFIKTNTLIITGERKIIDFSLSILYPTKINTNQNLNKEEYIDQVQAFIDVCSLNIQKVISSRVINKSINENLDLFEIVQTLASQNENALVYIYNIPTIGMWMGATPETLIHTKDTSIQTMALAGSQLSSKKEIVWEDKELQEHQFVIDDISTKLALKNYTYKIDKTETIVAGEVCHLKTSIKIDAQLKEAKNIADTLHPTAAICGMPQDKSFDFILKNENYEREFYTGYLGEISNYKQSWLFVNLRCMQIFNNSYNIYVGGGITKDSIAEKEWEETELKSRTLLAVIEKM